MWMPNWVWFRALRGERPRKINNDPADMGVEIGLDSTLDSLMPPLLDFSAEKGEATNTKVGPLGTDLRSHHRTGS